MANKYVAYAFTGIRVAVSFLILRAASGMFKKMKKQPEISISGCNFYSSGQGSATVR